MRKVLFLFFVTILFGSAFAQQDFLGKSKSEILANANDLEFKSLTTDDGVPFLFAEVAEFGKIFLFFNDADICNINALYPANDQIKDAVMDMLSQSAEKLGDNSWRMTSGDGVVELISYETDSDGEKYFLIILGE